MNPIVIRKATEYNIKDRGTAILVNMEENGFGELTAKEIKEKFMSKFIIYADSFYQIVGVETKAWDENLITNEAGFLIKKATFPE